MLCCVATTGIRRRADQNSVPLALDDKEFFRVADDVHSRCAEKSQRKRDEMTRAELPPVANEIMAICLFVPRGLLGTTRSKHAVDDRRAGSESEDAKMHHAHRCRRPAGYRKVLRAAETSVQSGSVKEDTRDQTSIKLVKT